MPIWDTVSDSCDFSCIFAFFFQDSYLQFCTVPIIFRHSLSLGHLLFWFILFCDHNCFCLFSCLVICLFVRPFYTEACFSNELLFFVFCFCVWGGGDKVSVGSLGWLQAFPGWPHPLSGGTKGVHPYIWFKWSTFKVVLYFELVQLFIPNTHLLNSLFFEVVSHCLLNSDLFRWFGYAILA